MVTIKELIEHLQQFDPEMEVITAKDEEGNGYNNIYLQFVGVSYFDGEDCRAVPEDYEDALLYDYADDEDKPTLEQWIERNELRKVVVI